MPGKVTLLLIVLFWFLAPVWVAGEQRCANQPEIIVQTDSAGTLDEICGAAEKAITFLGQYGLHPKRSITIEIVEEKIDNHGYLAYGRYESDRDRIQIMSYQAIFADSEVPTMYGEPFDRVYYAGVIAHEVAHAVVDHNLVERKYAAAPQEYLAHATQLAVLPEERRKAIIKAMGVKAWEGGDTISPEYMAMSPEKFGVKSYLHLTSMADPAEFVKILLNSKWLYVYVPKDDEQ